MQIISIAFLLVLGFISTAAAHIYRWDDSNILLSELDPILGVSFWEVDLPYADLLIQISHMLSRTEFNFPMQIFPMPT